MFEDQRRPRPGHVHIGVEVLDHKRPQILGVPRRDVEDEIVGAGQE